MANSRSVTIDAFPQSAFRHLERDAIVCFDTIRTTTTLVSSVSQGRGTYTAPDIETALELVRGLDSALLAVETEDIAPEDYSIRNSPYELVRRTDTWRPLVLVSRSGTPLILNASECPAVYITSFRNLSATAEYLAYQHESIALLSAGSDCQICCEDQMAAAWIAGKLIDRGFEPEDMRTVEAINRWSGTDISLLSLSNSAAYLRKCGREDDLGFVLSHVDDLNLVCYYQRQQIKPVTRSPKKVLSSISMNSGQDYPLSTVEVDCQ